MMDAADLFEQASEQEKLLRRAAMDLLARREHSRRELLTKLRNRCAVIELLEGVLDRLEHDNLLSDSRFAESYVRSRAGRGYGPVRIRQELIQKGIGLDICRLVLESGEVDWYQLACDCYQRRFGRAVCKDRKEKMRQMCYLQYRGFDSDMINNAIYGRAADR